jgi:hypothetical protein
MLQWALFIWLIIRTFQLVFSAETVFFSHNKSAFSRLISTAETTFSFVGAEFWELKMKKLPISGILRSVAMQP